MQKITVSKSNPGIEGYRVYEIAKAIGVESKVVIAYLNETHGIFARSASSIVEPPSFAETIASLSPAWVETNTNCRRCGGEGSLDCDEGFGFYTCPRCHGDQVEMKVVLR